MPFPASGYTFCPVILNVWRCSLFFGLPLSVCQCDRNLQKLDHQLLLLWFFIFFSRWNKSQVLFYLNCFYFPIKLINATSFTSETVRKMLAAQHIKNYLWTWIQANPGEELSNMLLLNCYIKNFDIFIRFFSFWISFDIRYLLCNFHSFENSPKYSVLVI